MEACSQACEAAGGSGSGSGRGSSSTQHSTGCTAQHSLFPFQVPLPSPE
jgi:hypothetical protein